MKKKVLSIILFGCMAMSLIACGKNELQENSKKDTSISLKEMVDSVSFNETNWTEYVTDNVSKDMQIPDGKAKHMSTIYKDGDKEYRGYSQISDMGTKEEAVRLYTYEDKITQSQFYMQKKTDDTSNSKEVKDGQSYITYVVAQITYQTSEEKPFDEAIATWQGGFFPYICTNNIRGVNDLILALEIEKVDEKILKIASDLTSEEEIAYEITCDSDCGVVTISITNKPPIDKYDSRGISLEIECDNYFTLSISENYNENYSDTVPENFTMTISRPI